MNREDAEKAYREDIEYIYASDFLDSIMNCGGVVVSAILIIVLYIVLNR